MKLALTDALIQKLSLDNAPQWVENEETNEIELQWEKTDKPNYLVYDSHRSAPPGFAVRVGARATVYLVEKMVRGKKLKIDVGFHANFIESFFNFTGHLFTCSQFGFHGIQLTFCIAELPRKARHFAGHFAFFRFGCSFELAFASGNFAV